MRILDVNNFYAPTGGGVRTYHHRKLEYCSRDGDITAALVIPDILYSREQADTGVIYRLPSFPLGGSGYRMILRRKYLEKVIDDFRPDIIEVGSGYFLPGLIDPVASSRGIPVVGFYHSDYPETLIRQTFSLVPVLESMAVARAWRRVGRTYGRFAGTFAASRVMLTRLRRSGLKRLFHVPLGVDHNLFNPDRRSAAFRERTGAVGGKKLLLFMARLNPEKEISLLMKAYESFRQPDRAVLVIIGSGVLSGRVNRFAARYPEVTRLSYRADEDDVSGITASADIFLSLGSYETFCLAALEAMASGAVVVAPDAGGAGELVRGGGVLEPYEPGNPEALARAVSEALMLADRGAGLGNREFSMQFTWEKTFDTMKEFYSRIKREASSGELSAIEHPDGWWTL